MLPLMRNRPRDIANLGGRLVPSDKDELLQSKPNAKVVAFFSFLESMNGDLYYNTQSLENALRPECLLLQPAHKKQDSYSIHRSTLQAGAWPNLINKIR